MYGQKQRSREEETGKAKGGLKRCLISGKAGPNNSSSDMGDRIPRNHTSQENERGAGAGPTS